MAYQVFNILYITSLLSLNNIEYKIPFNIAKPEIKIELSKELKEISGLSWFAKNRLAAIQDEAGTIYIMDSNTGEIKEKIRFSLPGDFEGVEFVDGSLYAITSGGTLFSFKINNPKKVERIETPLYWKNNTEGLAYDVINHRMLIACKDQAGIKESQIKGKAIYSLDLSNHRLSEKPVVVLRKNALEKFIKIDKFKPSALSIDPLTGNIYILASVGNLLIVLNNRFGVIAVTKLPAKIYGQPEGICFSPEGDLYISNEGTQGNKSNFYHLLRKS